MKTTYFNYKPEVAQNPYSGFISFQHFRGEKLYSDCVVRPENNMTETEDYECYPIPDYVPQNGRHEGYYPDTSVAYIRILWKEFEPERGVYNYKFIEDILEKARAHDQTVIFRLMAHSTRACDDVPEWLKSIVDCPERPDGKRVKDSPTDPKFMELFLEAIKKLGERFDSDPTFDSIDISLPGSWGEGHKLELYPPELFTQIVDTYTGVFKNTFLVGQSYLPDLLKYANRTTTTGWRGDGFGDPNHLENIYPPRVEKISELWKTAPVSFESYWWLGEWQRKGWDIDNIIELSLKWHLSSFNAKSMAIPFEWKEKIDAWVRRMGYHYAIDSFACPEKAAIGEGVTFELSVDNIGVAPIYKKLPLQLVLKNEGNSYTVTTDVDLRKWFPGKHLEKLEIKLPDEMLCGEYDVEIGIFGNGKPTVFFATDAPMDGVAYKVGKITVE